MSGPASTTPESEAVVVVAAEVVLLSDMKDTGLGSLMVCESEMGESDLEPESCGSDSITLLCGFSSLSRILLSTTSSCPCP